jgi:hypothetical protein
LSAIGNPTKLILWARNTGAGLVEDGSVPDAGCEINTNPASGDRFLADMQELQGAVVASAAECNNSCGLHVHVDASDYSQYDLRRLVMLWALVERAMFDLAGKNRINNHYCVPSALPYVEALQKTENPKQWRTALALQLYKETGRQVRSSKSNRYDSARYFALNLHSFFFRKTLEFRLHEGTTDSATLQNWPLVCAHIVNAALRMKEKDLIALARSEETATDILGSILPTFLRQWVQKTLAARHSARAQFGTTESVDASLNALDNGRRKLVQDAERRKPEKSMGQVYPSLFFQTGVL